MESGGGHYLQLQTRNIIFSKSYHFEDFSIGRNWNLVQLHTRNCKRKKNNIYFASKWDKWVQASELNWNLNFESWKDIKNSGENNVYCLRTVCKRLGVSKCQEHKSLSFNKCKRVFLKSKYPTKQTFKTAISFLAPHPQGQQIRISLKLNGQWALQKEEIALWPTL